jgi:hypothetical protein
VSGVSGGTLYNYQVTSEQRHQPALRIQPLSKVKVAKGSASFGDGLPPVSLTIYFTYDLSHTERGVVSE